MPRRPFPPQALKAMSIRLQQAIDRQFGSLYRLQQQLKAEGREALASTVRGWLPPQDRWAKEPERGSKVRQVDWQTVKAPDLVTLSEFCQHTQLRVDYLLFGEGPAFRHETAEVIALESALVEESLRRLPALPQAIARVLKPDGARLIDMAASVLAEEATAVEEFNRGLSGEINRAAQSLLRSFALASKDGVTHPLLAASRFADESSLLLLWIDSKLPVARSVSHGLVLVPWRQKDGRIAPEPALARDGAGRLTPRVIQGTQIALWRELAYLNVPQEVLSAIREFTNDFKGWSPSQSPPA